MNEKEFIPEQPEDNDFEKEKEELKKAKKEKKLEKKKKEVIEYDESGNVIKKKNSKKIVITIIIVLAIIALIIGGIVAYFVINLNKPENIISDFEKYFNNGQWSETIKCVDIKGLYTLANLDESKYTEFDKAYEEAEKDEMYIQLKEEIESLKDKEEKGFSTLFGGSSIKLGKVTSVEKIENTKSLYRIKVEITINGNEQELTDLYDIYVAKIDKQYKMVGGELPALIINAYQYIDYMNL